jgi:hypothetical protein
MAMFQQFRMAGCTKSTVLKAEQLSLRFPLEILSYPLPRCRATSLARVHVERINMRKIIKGGRHVFVGD